MVEVPSTFQLPRQGVQQPTAPTFQQTIPIRRPERRQQARHGRPTGAQARAAPKLADLLPQRVEAEIALKRCSVHELPRLAAERNGLEAEHAKVAQHEGREILLPVAEEEQLVEMQMIRLAQAQPTAVPANPPPAYPLGNPRRDAADALRLGPRAGNLPEQAPKLRHRQQFKQRFRRHRRTPLDKPKLREFRQRCFDVANLGVAQLVLPNQRPPANEASKEPLARRARRPQVQAEPKLLRFENVPVAFKHGVDEREQVLGVVVRRRGRAGAQPHHRHSGCRGVRVGLGHRLGSSSRSRNRTPSCTFAHYFMRGAASPQATPAKPRP